MNSTSIQSTERATAFISYAREDKQFVLALCESLKERGVEPVGDWLLIGGQRYETTLHDYNLGSQAFVFVISPDSIKSEPCLNELALAVENKKNVLPVSRRDHGDDKLLDSALRAPQWTFLREGDDYARGVNALVNAINTDFDLMETHGRLLLAAENWNNNGRNRSYLLRKDGLKEAEAWLAKTSAQPAKLPQPTPLEVEFIFAGQRARSRGARTALGVALAVAISLAALAVVALVQWSNAVRSAEEAQTQARIAKENEERALEVGKRRLLIATLLLNPEGYKLTTLNSSGGDLEFGIRPWLLKNGTLKTILQRFQSREPELFARIFGDGDPALAQRLIAYVATPATDAANAADKSSQGQPFPPEGNLDKEPWVSRFKQAGLEPAFQAIQLEEFTTEYLSFMQELQKFAPQVKTERGVAFMLDLAVQMGPKNAKKFFAQAQEEEPNGTEAELLQRIAELSVEWLSRSGAFARFVAPIERRRRMFLTTPFFSDNPLGF